MLLLFQSGASVSSTERACRQVSGLVSRPPVHFEGIRVQQLQQAVRGDEEALPRVRDGRCQRRGEDGEGQLRSSVWPDAGDAKLRTSAQGTRRWYAGIPVFRRLGQRSMLYFVNVVSNIDGWICCSTSSLTNDYFLRFEKSSKNRFKAVERLICSKMK